MRGATGLPRMLWKGGPLSRARQKTARPGKGTAFNHWLKYGRGQRAAPSQPGKAGEGAACGDPVVLALWFML